MPECRRSTPARRKENDWLIKHAYNVTSQGGEDGVLEKVFAVIGAQEAADGNLPADGRWCVEFGAWDGKHLSNTYKLLHDENWNGVLIEADKERTDKMQAMYANHPRVACINAFVTFDGEQSLEAILKRARVPRALDLISIDVDGADYHIWDSLHEIVPKVVVIEFNPTIPNNVVYIQDKDMSIYHGSSLAALIELGKSKGYELVSTTTFNGVFVRREYFALFGMADNSIDKMHDVPMLTEFFQLYDGTIKITGVKKLIWKQQPIMEKDLQVLSAAQRRFPFLPPDIEKDMAAAEARFQHATATGDVSAAIHFVELAHTWAVHCTHPNDDIRRFVGYALSLSPADSVIQDRVLQFYLANAESHLKANAPATAVQWLKQALYLPWGQVAQKKARLMTQLGDAYIRQQKFDKAEFWLQTSLALAPNAKPTLKAMAKLYTKQGRGDAQREIVDLLRSLDTADLR
ncbi:Aste57867_15905 [Aphanomyces stellatus]|uniref:Aste57867_15905 protein n=1 Tax=Aphanomyces stellatus TaxID=120398 RepID=A0A485L487_9STRA|nr:hypothetical protein As57867_015849 [Aphanomyces stellatus]VFT92691.1 Aste57867_15905 [Aphanomyces stellatus]